MKACKHNGIVAESCDTNTRVGTGCAPRGRRTWPYPPVGYLDDDSDLMEMTLDASGSALRVTECVVALFEAQSAGASPNPTRTRNYRACHGICCGTARATAISMDATALRVTDLGRNRPHRRLRTHVLWGLVAATTPARQLWAEELAAALSAV